MLHEAVSMIQPDILKSGKTYTKSHVPLKSELISSCKVNLGALYGLHTQKLWSYTSYLAATLPIAINYLQAEEIFI